MKLHNTLTRKVEEFRPLSSTNTTVYTCGPTVYDFPHIGNWFTFIRYDILVRALKENEISVSWVMNITDVGHLVSDADDGQDKLDKAAKKTGKTAWEIAEYFTNDFIDGMSKLNLLTPEFMPKATDHIKEQIDLISRLEKNGFTYRISDGIYYDTSKFKNYGKMANLDIGNLKASTRITVNPEKRSPTDFALWKFSPTDIKRDMEWDSHWGKGFPGWHLECSAMSMKYLGDTIDIHSGGIDHIPIHHTNEIAQSEAATNKQFSRFWVHMNHILLNEEKISKSLSNGITLEDIEKKHMPVLSLRMLVLESHYRTQAAFTWTSLMKASLRLESFQAMSDHRWQAISKDNFVNQELLRNYQESIKNELFNDLNTPKVLALLSKVQEDVDSHGIAAKNHQHFIDFLDYIDRILGLKLLSSLDISVSHKKLINDREKSRLNKDWNAADKIRDELFSNNIYINDKVHGPIWYRKLGDSQTPAVDVVD